MFQKNLEGKTQKEGKSLKSQNPPWNKTGNGPIPLGSVGKDQHERACCAVNLSGNGSIEAHAR